MAFTRKMLKALGIEEEKIEQIIEAHTEVTEALKTERDTYKADAEKLVGVEKELNDLKAKGDDGYKEKYEAEKTAHEKLKSDIANEKAHASKEAAYRELLKSAGVKEKFIDTIIRAEKSIIDGLEIGEDGKIANSENLTDSAKQNWGDFIATTTTKTAGVENPPANNGGSVKTKEEIYRVENGRYVLSASERQAELAKLYQHEQGE